MTEITKFDPEAFQKRVKDHIVNSFGAMLPEEQFATLVDKHVKDFFETEVELTVREVYSDRGYGSHKYEMTTAMTPLKQQVWETLKPLVQDRLAAYMKDTGIKHPIDKMLDELFAIPEFANHQVMTAQRMMLAMAGQFFNEQLRMAGLNAKGSISQAFLNAGMPEIARQISSVS